MKTPLCEKCILSDSLCHECKEKVNKGKLTACDIRVARNLYKITGNSEDFKDVEIITSVESPELIVVICKEGDARKIIGANGAIVKKLSSMLMKQIRIIEEPKNKEDFIKKLLNPVQVMGINILFTPQGEMLKVMIPKGKKPPVPDEHISDIMKKLYDQDLVIISE